VYDAFYRADEDRASRVLDRNDEGNYTAMSIQIGTDGNADRSAATTAVDDGVAAFDGELDAVGTGSFVVEEQLNTRLSATLIQSLVVTILAVLVILTGAFWLKERRPTLGPTTLVPVLLSAIWLFGTMALLDIPISIITAMVGSITVGIGVDYSIHVSERYWHERKHGRSIEEALRRTIAGTGSALMSSAVTTAVGFGVLAFALLPLASALRVRPRGGCRLLVRDGGLRPPEPACGLGTLRARVRRPSFVSPNPWREINESSKTSIRRRRPGQPAENNPCVVRLYWRCPCMKEYPTRRRFLAGSVGAMSTLPVGTASGDIWDDEDEILGDDDDDDDIEEPDWDDLWRAINRTETYLRRELSEDNTWYDDDLTHWDTTVRFEGAADLRTTVYYALLTDRIWGTKTNATTVSYICSTGGRPTAAGTTR